MTHVDALLACYGLVSVAALLGLGADLMRVHRGVAPASGVCLLLAGGVSLYSAWMLPAQSVRSVVAVGGGFSLGAGLIVLLAGAALLIPDAESAVSSGQRVALVALAAMGSGLAVQASTLVVMVLALETATLCGYALVASARTRVGAEAALKYFVQGAVASGLLLFAVVIVASGYSGTTDYIQVGLATVEGGRPLLLAVLLVVVALAFKAAAGPLHAWAPDAYESAPATAASVLAGPLKLGVLTVLAVLVSATAVGGASADEPLGALGGRTLLIVGALAVVSVVVGSVTALQQRSYTRMLAYAGVAQVGYALVAVSAASASVALLFSATYALGTTGAFAAAAAVRTLRPDWDGSVSGMRGLGRTSPVLGGALVVMLMSLAGIPPLIGFWGKFQALQAGVGIALGLGVRGEAALAWWYGIVVAVAIIGSVVSLAYYGAVLREVFTPLKAGPVGKTSQQRVAVAVVAALAVLVVVVGVLPLFVPFSALVIGFRL